MSLFAYKGINRFSHNMAHLSQYALLVPSSDAVEYIFFPHRIIVTMLGARQVVYEITSLVNVNKC